MKLSQVSRIRVKPTLLPKKYKEWIEFVPINAQWTMGVAGQPGAGKSSWLLEFGAILSKHGKLLYANFEENVAGGTIQQKVKTMKVLEKYPWAKNRMEFLESEKWSDLESMLKTGKYKYVIVDSVSKIKGKGKLNTTQILNLKDKFKDVSQVFVYHYRKDGKGFKGESDYEHEHDYFVEIARGGDAKFIKNRFKTQKTLSNTTMNVFN
jgi:predicted ATP-dependent serine protease